MKHEGYKVPSIKDLNEQIQQLAVEIDFGHRRENGYDFSDEEFYALHEKQKKLIEERDSLLMKEVAEIF